MGAGGPGRPGTTGERVSDEDDDNMSWVVLMDHCGV